ncbi:hypothetical protein [Mycolicibacterium sp.]|uniref:hypothetical protein n=1 Tax=Mycolicibacterium sp. TaxID=2320850 RepID=UPI0037C89175
MGVKVKYQGREFDVDGYVDPHPGKLGGDKVHVIERCGRCGGPGQFVAYIPVNGGVCFECNGQGRVHRYPRVSKLRRDAKIQALLAQYGEQLRADENAAREVEIAKRQAYELAAAHDAAIEEAARRAQMNNEPAGQPGDKVADLVGIVEVAKAIEVAGRYGRPEWKRFVVIKLESGQVVKSFGSAKALWEIHRGDKVRIVKANVKKLDEYQGQVQAVLSHVKAEVLEAAPEEGAA